MKTTTKLRQMINSDSLTVAPFVLNAFHAKIAESVGFQAVYMTGAGTSAERGFPDVGLLTMTEMVSNAKYIAGAVDIPVICDADTGYGNPLNVVRTVQECVRLGVAGIILEDQLWPKKCGHMEGKRVISIEEHGQKIRAAVYAREGNDLVIIARTDAIAPEGFDEALRRGRAYSAAGADVVFIEAPQRMEQLRTVAGAFDTPVFANMVEGGRTPRKSAAELQAIGYSLVIFPGGMVRALARTAQAYLASLKEHGSTLPFRDNMLDFDDLNELLGTDEMLALGADYDARNFEETDD